MNATIRRILLAKLTEARRQFRSRKTSSYDRLTLGLKIEQMKWALKQA